MHLRLGCAGVAHKTFSFNIENENVEAEKITGILKKHHYGKILTFEVNGKTIKCTPDHMMIVKNKLTGKIEEISAMKLKNEFTNYLLPVVDEE